MIDHPELDGLDLRLLEALQQNARSTFAELAGIVGLGSSAVHERVKRLEARGYLRAYRARVDPKKLGLGLVAYVSTYTTAEVSYDEFAAGVSALPEVLEIHSVAGEESFMCKVITRSTDHLDDFLSRLKALPGIARTKTTIVLSTPFEREGFAIDPLVGASARERGASDRGAIERAAVGTGARDERVDRLRAVGGGASAR
jgi:Lrp/AsnC family leucine-responsive transcriptional regulator